MDAQVTCAFCVDLVASNSLRRGDQRSPASYRFTRWGIVSRFHAWASMSSGEPNSNPVRAAASSVGGNCLCFEAELAAASNDEIEDGDVRLSPPSEARMRHASGDKS